MPVEASPPGEERQLLTIHDPATRQDINAEITADHHLTRLTSAESLPIFRAVAHFRDHPTPEDRDLMALRHASQKAGSDRAVTHVRVFLGQRLRVLRKRRRMSQMELGVRSSLSGQFIGEVERGKKSISIDSLYRVSVALGVPLYLLTDVGRSRQSVPSRDAERVLALVVDRPRPSIRRAYAVLETMLGPDRALSTARSALDKVRTRPRTLSEARLLLLRDHRTSLGDIARALGVDISSVSRVNKGARRSRNIEREIARRLRLTRAQAFPEWVSR